MMSKPLCKEDYFHHLDLSFGWIKKSILVNHGQGSSAYFSLKSFWSKAYPETSGYLIPTLIEYHKTRNSQEAIEHCEHLVKWLVSIQKKDGSFPQLLEDDRSLVFDNGQILLGLQAWNRLTNSNKNELDRLAYWLKKQRNQTGKYHQNTYLKNYCPSYLVRSLWAEVQHYHEQNTIENISSDFKEAINYYLSLQGENAFFLLSGFNPNDSNALSHTIAYTLRGILELYFILKDEKLLSAVLSASKKLAVDYHNNGKMAGTFNNNWKGDYSFVCNAGNAQLSIIFQKLYLLTKEELYHKAAISLITELTKKQITRGPSMLKGGLFSSTPFFGKYQRFKITNWTHKFYMDAIMLQLNSQ